VPPSGGLVAPPDPVASWANSATEKVQPAGLGGVNAQRVAIVRKLRQR
jgi:hypothetical protein